MQDDMTQQQRFALLRLLHRGALLVGLVAVALLIWYIAQIILLAFAGVLLAILLRSLSNALRRRVHIPDKFALALVVVGLLALIGLCGWLLIPNVADQLAVLLDALPETIDQVQRRIQNHPLGQRIMQWIPQDIAMLPDGTTIAQRLGGIFSTTIGILGSSLVLVFLGIYLAIEPQIYINGCVKLVPPDRRERAYQVFDNLGKTLRGWLLAKITAMLVIGVLTTVGLWLLGMPLALALGVIAALLSFIPNIGPILAEIPALLVAFNEGPLMALWVLLLYLGIQAVESYLLLPWLLRQSIELPPVLVLLGIMVLGSLFGILGVFVAAPLIASVMVLVKMLYIEDTLGDSDGQSSSSQQDKASSTSSDSANRTDGAQQQHSADTQHPR